MEDCNVANGLGLTDYKFYCFDGEPKWLYVSSGLEHHETAYISFYDMNYNPAPFGRADYKSFIEVPRKPIHFSLMKEIARRLSEGMPFVRVDLYEIDGRVFFSELTLYPCAGYMPFRPKEWDRYLGAELNLPLRNEITQ